MAFVILSAGTLTHSKMHTISIRALAGIVAVVVCGVLAGGFAMGYGYSRVTNEDGSGPLGGTVDQPQGRFLIDRFGELSGRLAQLEAEAVELAARIGTMKDFESRLSFGTVNGNQRDRTARTPPGAPSGGPMLRPQAALSSGESTAFSPLEAGDSLSQELMRMEQEIARVAGSLAQLDEIATSYNVAFMSFPARSPLPDAQFTSSFGNRIDPFRNRLAFHSGVDYPAPKGTPIVASAGGRVIYAGWRSEYGYTVEIDHGAGLATRYAHASKLHVKPGQVVMPGQLIAKVGSTGRSTGSHLHFEILQDGRYVDPARYLARN